MFSKSSLIITALLSAPILAMPATSVSRAALKSRSLVKREGINCEGSGLCPLAGFEDSLPVTILQGLRDAIYSTTQPDTLTFNDGDHIICITTSIPITIDASVDAGIGKEGSVSVGLSASGSIGAGGICAFMQDTGAATPLSTIKTLADGLLEHGCKVCGSNPTDSLTGGNDVSKGMLTFNYVSNPDCVGNCLSASGGQ
ncbi:hypothetical protein K461DRAFT_278571 [Myriangium duriaei CBS 260.36]|uniref:Killer toxin Kp4 domain-containing protein n=1 Tax=Myriangium duriaei CBS 260.36 TaxID=1168546 RepID=A0A9P4J1F6_9PEZI|nr:hypothetical protein K461DRAFT_278571 [Myriangium duriaei CBS 260.36]